MDNPLVQPDPGLYIWTILTFLVLLTLLAKFAWGPLLAALENREKVIASAVENAEKARKELERALRLRPDFDGADDAKKVLESLK